jgi:hypothetical protein
MPANVAELGAQTTVVTLDFDGLLSQKWLI